MQRLSDVQKTDIAAIDGGGSKTLLLRVRPDASIAEMRRAGGSNPFDVPDWQAVLAMLFKGQPECCRAAAFGLAGFGESCRLSSELSRYISSLCPVPHIIRNDADMACRGAFASGPGILILSGTGSIAWGQDAHGRTARVGGWGSLFGDEGSAYMIGRAALIELSKILDGRAADRDGYQARFAALQGWPEEPDACGAELQRWYGNLIEARPAVAALAVKVNRLAEEECAPAVEMIDHAARELAAHIIALRQRLDMPDMCWSYAGGTMQSQILRDMIARQCGQPRPPVLPPIGGVVLAAALCAGWVVDKPFITSLSRSLLNAGLN